jgi:hypothetical protein
MTTIKGNVDFSDYDFKEVPSILNDVSIEGSLNIADNRIKNLNNFPLDCESVYLSGNPLTSLVGIKQKYIRDLEASRTKIQNLEGCPETVFNLLIKNSPSFNSLRGTLKRISGSPGYLTITGTSLQTLEHCPQTNGNLSFRINYNKITSLVGMPDKCHDLDISDNNLTTLIGCPQHITGNFACKSNDLINFDGFPRVVGGDVFMSVSRMFGNPLMIQYHYFERELRQRCKIYGQVELYDPSDLLI